MDARTTIPGFRVGLRRRNGTSTAEHRQPAELDPGAKFDQELADRDAVVLHHRRAGAVTIDHLIVGSAGITVVDSSHYTDRRARVGRGGLRVGRRNRPDIVQDVLDKAAAVRDLLQETRYADVPVEAALAWHEVEGMPILHSFNAPRVIICGTRRIAREASRPGPISSRRVASLVTLLEAELPA